ncbi:ThiF family adenylyltransferase [Phocoenobacter skyensis]|uniref:ThiF family adenylyltransferase n=1 Tax=Phocoenobacter skyensis TaxID=97481 RepID=A0AAJ6P2Y4_9PAST|nr:ThiF family adenylyltransferase [Pasteurella skyensis]MDP8175229.1 ThiF family adenylyltransferase [Pasteurella skyensis]
MNKIRIAATQALSVKEYEPISEIDMKLDEHKDGSMFYKKSLKTQLYDIEFLVDFSELSLLDFPHIYISESVLNTLKEKYKHIQDPIPHLRKELLFYKNNALFSICYQLHNLNIVPRKNIYQIIEMMENHLIDLFNKLSSKGAFLNEYEKDFGGIAISLINLNKIIEHWYVIEHKNKTILLERDKKNSNLIFSKEQEHKIFCINNRLIPNFSGLVKNDKVIMKNFITFVKNWDFNLYREFMLFLKTPSISKKFIFRWRNFFLSGYFSWERISEKSLNHSQNQKLKDKIIHFVDIQMLDFKKSILRNLPDKHSQGLLKKKVLLVGLGAIGGYMAESLVKLGAGIESNFVLIDRDCFEADNVGRHLLGFEYCGKPKTLAVMEYLQNKSFFQLEKIRIESKNVSSFDIKYFTKHNFDLIIDATGSIEVQEYLNETLQELPKKERPILQHLWIYGNGECVQGLWIDPKVQVTKGGCISCLGSSSEGLYQYFLPIEDISPEQRMGVCSAFTPYAVSGGMMAASLGINMILEWLQTNQVTKNYQTRYSSINHGKKIDDMRLFANKQCLFCGGLK